MSRALATAAMGGGLGLLASQAFEERPWQAAVAVAVAMLVAGLLALVDERHVAKAPRRRCGYLDLTHRKDQS